MQLLHLVAILCCLATGFAVPTATIKWCAISDLELQKCQGLAERNPAFACVKEEDASHCITAIKNGLADAITLSGEYIFKAGLRNNDLVPIIAEEYSRDNSEVCSYSVAVAKKGTVFGLNGLGGKRSCHTGLGTSEGWNLPIGTLLSKGWITWEGADSKPLLQAISEFFSQSCVPGVNEQLHPNLCQACKGDCSSSLTNPYYGNAGAFKCLKEDAGQVAFMNPAEIPVSERNNYELLCQDNTRSPVENYKTCNLGQQPAHAVVTRKDNVLAHNIWTSLNSVKDFSLYSSNNYGGKNLLFSDSTVQIQQIPPDTDSFLYLGAQYTVNLQSLIKEQPWNKRTPSLRWCAVSGYELTKCDVWAGNSFDTTTGLSAIECHSAPTVEDCFEKIMRDEADAVAVDGGQVYTAGKCGLVPAMVEQYEEGKCSSSGQTSASSYNAVAVVKKGTGVTWGNLKGKRSCHTGMGRTAGWNIPMGHIHKETQSCNFSDFFPSGCAPGSNITSFCLNCKGSGRAIGDNSVCSPSADEQYYGYAGAFRCLVDGAGDVAFIKHTIVGENTNGNGPDWAAGLRSENYELICPGLKGSVPITDYESCKLAVVPAHAVMTRHDIKSEVVRILNDQQSLFGLNGSNDKFRMFQSAPVKNLLFKDSTKCLQAIPTDSYETFLGEDYMNAMQSLRECGNVTPNIEKSCTFQSCQ